MSLQLIIQEIKALGNILINPSAFNEEEENPEEMRRFRVKIGNEQFISRNFGEFISSSELLFSEPFSYIYDNSSHMLYIEIFKQHRYLDNSDLDHIMTAEIDLSDTSNLNGEYIEAALKKTSGVVVGKLLLMIETFKKGQKYYEKVSSKIFFEAVKEDKERQIQASAAARNIKNLMVNNALTDTLMTINAMTLICEKEDPQIFMREGFILVKYGPSIKAYSSLIKMSTKDSVNWTDYIEFMKNQGVKFEFFFFQYDELGVLICKAKGQIKYVIFDETINLHSITLYDKRNNKYGTLMVKFIEKEVDKVVINNKLEKKLKEQESLIQQTIEQFNQAKFENKNSNHILSEKLWELQQLQQHQEEQKQRPLNPQQKKKQEEHARFIQFLQKEMIKIERELMKRQQNNKKDERKNRYLPGIDVKKPNQSRVISPEHNRNMNISHSSTEFRGGAKFPRI